MEREGRCTRARTSSSSDTLRFLALGGDFGSCASWPGVPCPPAPRLSHRPSFSSAPAANKRVMFALSGFSKYMTTGGDLLVIISMYQFCTSVDQQRQTTQSMVPEIDRTSRLFVRWRVHVHVIMGGGAPRRPPMTIPCLHTNIQLLMCTSATNADTTSHGLPQWCCAALNNCLNLVFMPASYSQVWGPPI